MGGEPAQCDGDLAELISLGAGRQSPGPPQIFRGPRQKIRPTATRGAAAFRQSVGLPNHRVSVSGQVELLSHRGFLKTQSSILPRKRARLPGSGQKRKNPRIFPAANAVIKGRIGYGSEQESVVPATRGGF
jgi:hypothetical protein